MIEPRLQRGDDLREARALEIRERLRLMHEHRRRALDDILLQHEGQHLEQGVAVGVGKRLLHVGRDVAQVGTGRHGFS